MPPSEPFEVRVRGVVSRMFDDILPAMRAMVLLGAGASIVRGDGVLLASMPTARRKWGAVRVPETVGLLEAAE